MLILSLQLWHHLLSTNSLMGGGVGVGRGKEGVSARLSTTLSSAVSPWRSPCPHSALPLEGTLCFPLCPWNIHLTQLVGLEILSTSDKPMSFTARQFFFSCILASSPTLIANANNNVPLLVPQKNGFFHFISSWRERINWSVLKYFLISYKLQKKKQQVHCVNIS